MPPQESLYVVLDAEVQPSSDLRHEATAQRQDQPALTPEQFTVSLAKLCEGTSVYAREIRGTVYLVNVRFAHQSARVAKPASVPRLGPGPRSSQSGKRP